MSSNQQFSEEDQEILEAFNLFDKSGDHKIQISELSSVFRSLGYNFTVDDIREMLREIDDQTLNNQLREDQDYGLDFETFKKLLKKQEEKLKDGEDELIDAFRVFDRDGNGVITAEELKQVMQSLGESLSDLEIDDMIKAAASSDQQVTLKDFVSIYLK